MLRIFSSLVLVVYSSCTLLAWADSKPAGKEPANAATPAPYKLPEGITEEMLAPPPVPRFMLEKPSKPLTQSEMQAQIREAELKSGITITQPAVK